MSQFIALGATAAGIALYLALVYSLPFLLLFSAVQGAVLEVESPPMVLEEGLTQSDDGKDRDINVNFDDIDDDEFAQLQNQTLMVSTKGADDFDMDGFPPEGVTTVITHDSVIVSKVPVRFELTNQIEQPLLQIISDTAKEYSNGTVIIDLPPPQNVTTDLLGSENESSDDDDDDDEDSG